MLRPLEFAAVIAIIAAPATAQEFDPAAIDLAKMIGCEIDARDYNGFAMWFATEPDAAGRLGWSPVAQDNPFLAQFALSEPVSVFGHTVKAIAFTATGPLAVLPDVDPRELATSLGIEPALDGMGKFLGERILVQESEDADGSKIETTVSLNVSTVDTHPGMTLAGCSYRVEIK